MPDLDQLTPEQLRTLAGELFTQVQARDEAIAQRDQAIVQRDVAITQKEAVIEDKDRLINQHESSLVAKDQIIAERDRAIALYKIREDKLSHEMALLRRYQFGKRSEGLDSQQMSMLEDLVEADIAAIETEMAKISVKPKSERPKQQAKRQALPKEFARTEIHHEPDSSTCSCGCQRERIGEDVHEKLDYQPGTFTVERHIRGKWVCRECETLTQAPVPPHIIDKGIPTTGLLAQVLVSKYADHQPLYRQEQIYARAGMHLPRSTLADWIGRCGVELRPLIEALREELLTHSVLHADETPVAMLAPGKKKTHRAYVWAYTSTQFAPVQGVVYEFWPGRSGEAVRTFLDDWKGKLICDDFKGYKACFKNGITEIGCMAHARRKFYDLHVANQSPVAEQALNTFRLLYEIEREAAELYIQQRYQLRQEQAKPILDKLHEWLLLKRQQVNNGTATAKAIDYSLKRWVALIRYLDDGEVPIDNNWCENQIRPWALGRSNWLFAGSLRSGQRAANIMSLIQSAKINGLDPHAYLKDVMERLPTQKANQIQELLPHNWSSDRKV